MPKKPKSLSEKLFAALEGEKRVEELLEEDGDEESRAKTVGDDADSDEEIDVPSYGGTSALRAANAPSLADIDSRYSGKKVSRKDLDEVEQESAEWGHMFEVGSSDEEVEEQDEEEESGNEEDVQEEEFEIENEEEEENGDEEGEEGESDFDDGEDHFAALDESGGMEVEDSSNNAQLLFETDDTEVEKGTHIRNQLIMYDKLLEMRIQLQKVLSTSMRFPKAGASWDSNITEEDQGALQECNQGLLDFLESCLRAKKDLVENNSDLRKRKNVSDVLCETAKRTKLSDYENALSESSAGSGAWRDEVLDIWNEKTRLVSSGGKKGSNFSSFEISTLKQIDNILCDKKRLIGRTRVRRVEYDILGEDEEWEESEDPEIFDDGDFYHQLLRELISAKTAGVEDPNELGRNWVEVQRIRSKMKKKMTVDTKASKGRKIRYDIHAKLVNFMAPVYIESINDEAKNELYSSLFGQRPKGAVEP